MNDELLKYTTPNMNARTDGSGCFGGAFQMSRTQTVDEQIQYAIDYLYNSAYNNDLQGGSVGSLAPQAIRDIELPETFEGVNRQTITRNSVVSYLIRWHLWGEAALNPKADVCELPWRVDTTLAHALEAALGDHV